MLFAHEKIKRICLDIETYDPELKTRGPGFVYGKDSPSFVVGVAVAWQLQSGAVHSRYLPWRHVSGGNHDIEQDKAFLADIDRRGIEIVGANIHYDLEGLKSEGLEFRNCKKRDVQVAEFLINDTAESYSLASLIEKYLPGQRKTVNELKEKGEEILGKGKDVYLNMHNLPPYVVKSYARNDAELTLQVYDKQLPILKKDGLIDAFDLECDLIDYVQDVRWRGIRIDVEQAEKVCKELQAQCDKQLGILYQLSGNTDLNIWSQKDIEAAAGKLGLNFPKTAKDNASFTALWMVARPELFWQALHSARQLDRGGSVFVKSKILDLIHNGRLYYQLVQVRGEQGGTVSSRFSSRNPNMQQIPVRNSELAKKIRSLFLPEPGETWVSIDESQAEIRATLHYAKLLDLPGAGECVQQYIDNPDTDYHQWVADLTGINRREAKTITFAILYGAGSSKIANELGVDKDKAKEILDVYNRKLQFAKPLSNRCVRAAQTKGYIKTILGRRRHFTLYGPPSWEKGITPKQYSLAVKEFGPYVQRYFVHKSLNALIQGSCADIHKLGLRDIYIKKLPLCILPIHDEMNFSVKDMGSVVDIKNTILDSRKLLVPRQVIIKNGVNFGSLKELQ